MSPIPYDTSVLDRARAERRAEWEQRRQATLARVLAVLDEWLPRYGVTDAYVFGSLAQPGRYHAGSDIDIAVVWHGRDFFDMAGEISHRLGQDIDILPLASLPFADKIVREDTLDSRDASLIEAEVHPLLLADMERFLGQLRAVD